MAGTADPLGHVGKVLVKHGYVVNKVVGLAPIAEDILESPYGMILDLDLLALYLRPIEQFDQAVLVRAVVVERERKRFSAGVHSCLCEV